MLLWGIGSKQPTRFLIWVICFFVPFFSFGQGVSFIFQNVTLHLWCFSRFVVLKNGRYVAQTLSTWDFAGQEDFYCQHQCFLFGKALYLVYINDTLPPSYKIAKSCYYSVSVSGGLQSEQWREWVDYSEALVAQHPGTRSQVSCDCGWYPQRPTSRRWIHHRFTKSCWWVNNANRQVTQVHLLWFSLATRAQAIKTMRESIMEMFNNPGEYRKLALLLLNAHHWQKAWEKF